MWNATNNFPDKVSQPMSQTWNSIAMWCHAWCSHGQNNKVSITPYLFLCNRYSSHPRMISPKVLKSARKWTKLEIFYFYSTFFLIFFCALWESRHEALRSRIIQIKKMVKALEGISKFCYLNRYYISFF